MTTSFLATVLGAWGRGPTEDEARGRCIAAGASRRERMIIYENTHADDQEPPHVDGNGFVCYYGELRHTATYEKNKRQATAASA
jgi:hypothetical protein